MNLTGAEKVFARAGHLIYEVLDLKVLASI